jgi:hypothetical protein
MDKQTDADFEQETCLSFLIHTYMALEILGLVKTQRDMAEETEDDAGQSGDDLFSHYSDRK